MNYLRTNVCQQWAYHFLHFIFRFGRSMKRARILLTTVDIFLLWSFALIRHAICSPCPCPWAFCGLTAGTGSSFFPLDFLAAFPTLGFGTGLSFPSSERLRKRNMYNWKCFASARLIENGHCTLFNLNATNWIQILLLLI